MCSSDLFPSHDTMGDGTKTDRSTPQQVISGGAISIETSSSDSVVIKEDGTLWTTGYKTGSNTFIKKLTSVKSVSYGVANIMALKTDGSLWERDSENRWKKKITEIKDCSGSSDWNFGTGIFVVKKDGSLGGNRRSELFRRDNYGSKKNRWWKWTYIGFKRRRQCVGVWRKWVWTVGRRDNCIKRYTAADNDRC